MAVQRAISSMVRPQPRHSPERASSVQILMQGLSIIVRLGGRIGCDHRYRGREYNRAIVASSWVQVPARNSGRRLSRRLSSGLRSGSPGGVIGGAVIPHVSPIGAMAATTRSGGKVTTTSVPMLNFDLSTKVPPCRSVRLLAIGNPRPAPCSADLIEFEPWPKEESTIGISSSGMPGPVSFTLMYWPPEAVQPTFNQTSPPCGVNLIAFDNRLRQIWRTARSSAHS